MFVLCCVEIPVFAPNSWCMFGPLGCQDFPVLGLCVEIVVHFACWEFEIGLGHVLAAGLGPKNSQSRPNAVMNLEFLITTL